MTDRKAFAVRMNGLCAALGAEPTETLLTAYWEALSDLTDADFAAASSKALRGCKFMPRPVELRDLVGRGNKTAADALTAWTAVRKAMDEHDYTRSVDFGPVVNASVRAAAGTWYALCDQGERDLIFTRDKFLAAYETFAHADGILHGEPLPGSFGGAPVRISIGGKAPPLPALPPANGVHADVRMLADAKAFR